MILYFYFISAEKGYWLCDDTLKCAGMHLDWLICHLRNGPLRNGYSDTEYSNKRGIAKLALCLFQRPLPQVNFIILLTASF